MISIIILNFYPFLLTPHGPLVIISHSYHIAILIMLLIRDSLLALLLFLSKYSHYFSVFDECSEDGDIIISFFEL